MLISTGGAPRRHVHWITAQHSQEGREFLNLRECVLCSNLSHGSLEVHVEHVLEVLCGPYIGIIDQPDRTVTVRP